MFYTKKSLEKLIKIFFFIYLLIGSLICIFMCFRYLNTIPLVGINWSVNERFREMSTEPVRFINIILPVFISSVLSRWNSPASTGLWLGAVRSVWMPWLHLVLYLWLQKIPKGCQLILKSLFSLWYLVPYMQMESKYFLACKG